MKQFIVVHHDSKGRTFYRTLEDGSSERVWQPFREKAEIYGVSQVKDLLISFSSELEIGDDLRIVRVA
jgi:hypothetical protein